MRLFLQLGKRILCLLRVFALRIDFEDFLVPPSRGPIVAELRTDLPKIHQNQHVFRISLVRLLKPFAHLRIVTSDRVIQRDVIEGVGMIRKLLSCEGRNFEKPLVVLGILLLLVIHAVAV